MKPGPEADPPYPESVDVFAVVKSIAPASGNVAERRGGCMSPVYQRGSRVLELSRRHLTAAGWPFAKCAAWAHRVRWASAVRRLRTAAASYRAREPHVHSSLPLRLCTVLWRAVAHPAHGVSHVHGPLVSRVLALFVVISFDSAAYHLLCFFTYFPPRAYSLSSDSPHSLVSHTRVGTADGRGRASQNICTNRTAPIKSRTSF